jgi:hypothetical protein
MIIHHHYLHSPASKKILALPLSGNIIILRIPVSHEIKGQIIKLLLIV